MVGSVRIIYGKGAIEGRHPLEVSVGNATDVGALSSSRQGSAADCALNVPGCQTFGLLFVEYVEPEDIAGAADRAR